jgi:hypothetical protein
MTKTLGKKVAEFDTFADNDGQHRCGDGYGDHGGSCSYYCLTEGENREKLNILKHIKSNNSL